MAVNRGKQFEDVIKEAFENTPGCCITRLHDQTTGFAGSKNICDFIAYRYPNIFYLECKSCHGNTFPFSNITDNQMKGLLEKAEVEGVISGIVVWWIDNDITRFIPITLIQAWKNQGYKSVRYDYEFGIEIQGKKKRVFFDYDIKKFLEEVQGEF